MSASSTLTSTVGKTAPLGKTGAGNLADARARLDGVLARPEFQPPVENPIIGFLRDLLRPVAEPIGDFLRRVGRWIVERLREVDYQAPWWRFPLAVLGIMLLGGLLLWVTLRLRQTMGRAPARVVLAREGGGDSSEGLRAEAVRLSQQGDFRGAVRALYLAALLYWQERGQLRFDRALTNREVLVRARRESEPGLAETLGLLVERFDRVWYGGAACTQAEYADFAGLTARVWEAT